ncbi:MAG TPA: D-TA family PLP-dependent enzyme [Longimicrobiaceae bacterium]|nr:D-TA family PLP-dependent enzyme [Longimicrobiaceae bacterium]
MKLGEVETPAAVVELAKMRTNLERAASYCRRHGLAWRPHCKTHKTPEIARMQVAAGAVGVSVATPGEAVVMATAVDDLLLAYPPLGDSKLQRLMALPAGVRLTVGLDSVEALRGLAGAARAAGRSVGVLIELDMGMNRVGVQTPEGAVALAREVAELGGVEYGGVMFYPGHIRAHVAEQGPLIAALSDRLASFREALISAGLEPQVVSGGSTPTFWRSHEIEGLTEVRPGTNIFNDRTTALVGACDWSECAYSILATVVSTSVPGQVVIDAGSKALAKEELRAEGGGFGALLDRPEIIVKSLSEEHGVLDLSATDWRPKVGDRVRVVPNHVCVSVNLHERLWGVEGGEVVHEWRVAGRSRTPE